MTIHFLLLLFAWPYGILVGNLIASAITTGLAMGYALRKFNCKTPRCPRMGRHLVKGTTYHTCARHTTEVYHTMLHRMHAKQRPEQHDLLNP